MVWPSHMLRSRAIQGAVVKGQEAPVLEGGAWRSQGSLRTQCMELLRHTVICFVQGLQPVGDEANPPQLEWQTGTCATQWEGSASDAENESQ